MTNTPETILASTQVSEAATGEGHLPLTDFPKVFTHEEMFVNFHVASGLTKEDFSALIAGDHFNHQH